jgi:hypothetical protein
MPAGANVTLRLSVVNPVKGVAYSLQDKKSTPVDVRVGTGKTLVFEIPVRLETGKSGPRFLGHFVRTEGAMRRFVYVATGGQAGQRDSAWSRRAKIDLPDITQAMMKKASGKGLMLEAEMPGTDAEGGPTCATVRVAWRVAG